jgi:hypothetical protein
MKGKMKTQTMQSIIDEYRRTASPQNLRLHFRDDAEFDRCVAIGKKHGFADSEICIFIALRVHNGKIMKKNRNTGNWENIKPHQLEHEIVQFCVSRQMIPNRNED